MRLLAVHPVLMSSDVRASIAFYERLGFKLGFQDDPAKPRYAGIIRDSVELHLQWHDEAKSGDRPVYRFLVDDVDALFTELGDAVGQQQSPWRKPGDTPWGTREFHVRDPDGNGLQFYRSR